MTHCERVLELLADGEWHSHHELYALHVIAHSRVPTALPADGRGVRPGEHGDRRLADQHGHHSAGEPNGPSPSLVDTTYDPSGVSSPAEQLTLEAVA